MDKKTRQECEALIYETMDALDKTRTNSEYYKKLFSSMSDDQFSSYMKNDFPFKFHMRPFEIEPSMSDIEKAAKVVGIPLLEKVALPYLYTNKDGVPVNSQECIVGYIHLKKVQQFITKKNAMSSDIAERDMKTGLLVGFDKNGKTSDREMESLAVSGLDQTMKELSRPRADSMKAKSVMYNTINTLGSVNLKDIPIDIEDSISKNLMNTYLLGAGLQSNIVNQEYYLPYTLLNKKKAISRV